MTVLLLDVIVRTESTQQQEGAGGGGDGSGTVTTVHLLGATPTGADALHKGEGEWEVVVLMCWGVWTYYLLIKGCCTSPTAVIFQIY